MLSVRTATSGRTAYRAEDFPGCESFHLPASEIEHCEGRLEFRDGVTETAWKVCEPTSIQDEQPFPEIRVLDGRADRVVARALGADHSTCCRGAGYRRTWRAGRFRGCARRWLTCRALTEDPMYLETAWRALELHGAGDGRATRARRRNTVRSRSPSARAHGDRDVRHGSGLGHARGLPAIERGRARPPTWKSWPRLGPGAS